MKNNKNTSIELPIWILTWLRPYSTDQNQHLDQNKHLDPTPHLNPTLTMIQT